MKKLFFIGLTLFPIFHVSHNLCVSKVFSYAGTVQFPWVTDPKKSPSLTVYYKGAVIPCNDGGYMFTDTEKKSSLYLIVTHLQKPIANTIDHIEVPKGSTYTLYKLTRTPCTGSKDSFEETWDIEKKESFGPYSIPQDAVIIVMDPACIASISATPWSKEGISMKLPTLTFKKDAVQDATYNRSLLASLDLRSFHASDTFVSQKQTPKSVSTFRK